MVIDADGLNMLAGNKGLLQKTHHKIIVTPHPKEMSRLTGASIESIVGDRAKAASEFALRQNITVLLKGLNTVISSPKGELLINAPGNPGMATAGTGDVLSGIIGAFAAHGLNPADAAICGAFVHGYAGDLAGQEKGFSGMTASDIIELIPKSINAIMGVK
jgi:ADP-dependent NAD(P)H-hydrate dehydratase / NAD(P)H-hydrate epimerase